MTKKELSIEEKAKAYDEVVERAKMEKEKSRNLGLLEFIENAFPELKESEDVKTKKRIIALVSAHGQGMYKEEMLAWLEKKRYSEFELENEYWRGYNDAKRKGEQKPVEMKTPEKSLGIDSETYSKIVDECIYGEQKPVDKVEPKFHKGEWLIKRPGYIEVSKEKPRGI